MVIAGADHIHTVLVPGLCCSARQYDSIYADVWTYGSVAIADTRRDESLAAIAARLLAEAPERFALAGLSMGGYIALEVMRQAPERVVKLALISTGARADSAEQAENRRQQMELVHGGKFDGLVRGAFPFLTAPANQSREDVRAAWKLMAQDVGPEAFCRQLEAVAARPASLDVLAGIACPTTVIHGADDQLIDVENAQELVSGIARSTLTVIEDAGHMIPQEQPDAFRAAMRDWLDGAV